MCKKTAVLNSGLVASLPGSLRWVAVVFATLAVDARKEAVECSYDETVLAGQMPGCYCQ